MSIFVCSQKVFSRTAKVIVTVAFTTLLASCSSEPSASDIEGALRKQMEDEYVQAKRFAGGLGGNNADADEMMSAFEIKIADFEKIGCRPDGDKVHLCDVSFKISGGFMGKKGHEVAQPLRVARSDSRWIISR